MRSKFDLSAGHRLKLIVMCALIYNGICTLSAHNHSHFLSKQKCLELGK